MCGEHQAGDFLSVGQSGSPPHVRGAPQLVLKSYGTVGIIPACAGSTRRALTGYRGNGDHPRMCGEHVSDCFNEVGG